MKRRTKIIITATAILVFYIYMLRFSPISYSILRFSAQEGYHLIVAALLAIGVDPDRSDQTALSRAITNNHLAIAELLIHHSVNIECQWMSGEPNGPPLAWALMYGEPDMAKMLLRHGARANYIPRYLGTNTSLHMAVELNDPELVKLLLKNGADPNVRDECGVTALMVAVAHKRHEIARILRRAGAKVNTNASVSISGRYCIKAWKYSEP